MRGNNEHIPIRNVYHMLAYAFQTFQFTSMESKLGKESFDNIYDLFAEILLMGISIQLKKGLHKEYVLNSESISTLKGRIDLQKTIREKNNGKQLLHCIYDEWSEDNIYNQILRTTILSLIKREEVEHTRKQKLKALLPLFSNVSILSYHQINWAAIHYDNKSSLYQMLHFVCCLVLERKLIATSNTNKANKIFWNDERMMCTLYEKFLLGYYKKHHSYLSPKSEEISWAIDKEKSSCGIIPKMKSDIVLHGNSRTLIIDAKFYGKTLTENYNRKALRSSHLYQISTYVMNTDKGHNGDIDGMLLYAQTVDEEMILDDRITYTDGNVIYLKTLNLNQEFSEIMIQLDSIARLIS